MAITTSFGYTNTTASTDTVAPIAIGVSTNYTADALDDKKSKDKGKKLTFKNLTSPGDQTETITVMEQDINTINQVYPNANPVKNVPFKMVTIKCEAKKRATSSTDDYFVKDYPVTTQISFRFPVSQYVTASDLREQLLRLCEALAINASSPTARIQKLMLGQLDLTA